MWIQREHRLYGVKRMSFKNNKKCECGSDEVFTACMPSGTYCYGCGKKVEE